MTTTGMQIDSDEGVRTVLAPASVGETSRLGGGLLLSLAYAAGFAVAGRGILPRRELA